MFQTRHINKIHMIAGLGFKYRRQFSELVQNYNISNLVEMQISSCKINKDCNFLGTKKGSNFEFIKFGEFAEQVDKFRGVLSKHRIGVNDKIALISNNRLEWAVAYYAANGLGAQIVPMYEAQSEKDWLYIIKDSEAKLILAATESVYKKTSEYANNYANVQSVLCFDANPDYLHSYQRWMATIEKSEIPPPFMPNKDHLTTIIYTSGTTGNPKGVELSHGNIVANILGLKELWGEKLGLRRTSLTFLPWAHVFGMTCDLHALLGSGSSAAIAPSREALAECMTIVQPSAMSSVPLLFNKVYDGVQAAFAAESPLKQKIIKTAFAVARERNHALEFGQPVSAFLEFKHGIADKVVFSKIRQRMGGNLQYMGSGGAATSLSVLQFFEDIGVPICEGYGLTETSPVITASMVGWKDRRLGCVGRALDGVTVKIMNPEGVEVPLGDEGEIWASGDSVMVGYRNNKAANDEVFAYVNGVRYFRTGDLGKMVDTRYLKITGRIKELYKLENGKYVVPAPLEDAVCRSKFIQQCYIFGANKPFNVALIVPEMAEFIKHVKEDSATYGKIAPDGKLDLENKELLMNLLNNHNIATLFNSEITQACSTMKGFEKIHRYAFVLDPFTQENQMMTPKMSLRRNNVHKAYGHLVDALYEGVIGHKVINKSKATEDA